MPSTTHEIRHIARQSDSSSQTRKLSCSECRRLKLRCTRTWPCSSCVKRGCASICPTGSLTPGGGGNRFILHGSEELHLKIREMSGRIASLEDTVGCMWAAKTGGKEGEHPMLRKELLKIKEMPDTQNMGNLVRGGEEGLLESLREGSGGPGGNEGGCGAGEGVTIVKIKQEETDGECTEDKKEECIVSGLGTLTIGDNGRRHYMGRSARIEFIFPQEDLNADPLTLSDQSQPFTSPSPSASASASVPSPNNGVFEDPNMNMNGTPPTPESTLHSVSASTPVSTNFASSSSPYHRDQRHMSLPLNGNGTASGYPPLPEPVISLAQGFICAKPSSSPVTLKYLVDLLPPIERGWSLLEAFYENAAWFYAPLRRDMFIDIIFSHFYRRGPPSVVSVNTVSSESGSGSGGVGDLNTTGRDSSGLGGFAPNPPKGTWARLHSGDLIGCPNSTQSPPREPPNKPTNPTVPGPAELSILYMVLTIGSLVDLSQQISIASSEADRFYSLAKSALCLERALEEGCTVAFVQAVTMMCCYSCQWSAKSMEVEKNWAYVGLATRMALSLGLHRDSSRWNLPCFETQLRRYTFWELFSLDMWTALAYGRPPSLRLNQIDCALPVDRYERRDESGKVIARNFKIYKYMFLKECIHPVIEHIFETNKPFSYSSVQALDRRVRAFDFGTLASEMQDDGCGGGVNAAGELSIGGMMQRQLVLCIKESVLLYIHRSFFTRVMTEHPNNPLDSPYAASVLATFRCAVTVLQVIRSCLIKHPVLMSRFWLCWSQLMTSAVVTSSICSRGPKCTIAPAAFAQLRICVELFEGARVNTPRLNFVMPTLYRLQDTAYKAIIAVGPGLRHIPPPAGRPESVLGSNAATGNRKSSSPAVSASSPSVSGNGRREEGSPPSVRQGSASSNAGSGSANGNGEVIDLNEVDGEGCNENTDALAAYGGRARVIHRESSGKGTGDSGSLGTFIPPRTSGNRHASGEKSNTGTKKPFKASLWFDANFQNTNGDNTNPMEFSSFVTSPSTTNGNGGGLNTTATPSNTNGTGKTGRRSVFTPATSASPPNTTATSANGQTLPFVQYLQDSVNANSNIARSPNFVTPSNIINDTTNGTSVNANVDDGNGANRDDTVMTDDYSWLDGFGVGAPNVTAGMEQLPLAGTQNIPMLFGGGGVGGNSSSGGGGVGGNSSSGGGSSSTVPGVGMNGSGGIGTNAQSHNNTNPLSPFTFPTNGLNFTGIGASVGMGAVGMMPGMNSSLGMNMNGLGMGSVGDMNMNMGMGGFGGMGTGMGLGGMGMGGMGMGMGMNMGGAKMALGLSVAEMFGDVDGSGRFIGSGSGSGSGPGNPNSISNSNANTDSITNNGASHDRQNSGDNISASQVGTSSPPSQNSNRRQTPGGSGLSQGSGQQGANADSLPAEMFGYSNLLSSGKSIPTSQFSSLFPSSSTNVPSSSNITANTSLPQNSWFFSNFSDTESPPQMTAQTFDMNVDSVDPSVGTAAASSVNGGTGVPKVSEPALHDASWQEYMRQVFVSGGGIGGNRNVGGGEMGW